MSGIASNNKRGQFIILKTAKETEIDLVILTSEVSCTLINVKDC